MPMKTREIVAICISDKISLKNMKPRMAVIGNSISRRTSITDSFPSLSASKSSIATTKLTKPIKESSMIFGNVKNSGSSDKTNGKSPSAPIMPMNASDSASPILRVERWTKKSPTPQKSIAPNAARMLNSKAMFEYVKIRIIKVLDFVKYNVSEKHK